MSPRRQWAAWSLAATLALAGTQVAHALAYRIAIPDPNRRAEDLAASGHQYLGYLPLAFGFLSAGLIVGFACQLKHLLRHSPYRGPKLVRFALFAPLLFTAQEHLERLIRTGSFPWSAAGDRTFVLGLALQLPFALLAYFVARLLLRVAHRAARWLFGAHGAPHTRFQQRFDFVSFEAPAFELLSFGSSPRGPPARLH